MNEIWKQVPDFPDYYVSNKGRVVTTRLRYVCLKPTIDKKGYENITITDRNKKRLHTRVHVLVAKAFIPNPCNYEQVNHKDENKRNNCVENLEWCDTRYNIAYSLKKKIRQYTADTHEFIAEYANTVEAQKATKIKKSNITATCRKEQHTAGGFYWEYA